MRDHHSVFLFALLSWTIGQTLAQELADILPGCVEASTAAEVAECLVQYSDPVCFNQSSPSALKICFQEEYEPPETRRNLTIQARQVFAASELCLEPHVDCLNETVTDALDDLPPCVESTVKALGQCFVENVETCAGPCSEVAVDLATREGSPYAGLTFVDVRNCELVEENVLFPACQTLNCCPPCLDTFEDVAECVVNDVLNLFPRGDDCVFECENAPGVDRRGLRKNQEVYDSRTLSELGASANHLWEACGKLTPGIVGAGQETPLLNSLTVEAVDQRDLLARSNFFDCLAAASLGSYEVMSDMPTMSPSSAAVIYPERMLAKTIALYVASYFISSW